MRRRTWLAPLVFAVWFAVWLGYEAAFHDHGWWRALDVVASTAAFLLVLQGLLASRKVRHR